FADSADLMGLLVVDPASRVLHSWVGLIHPVAVSALPWAAVDQTAAVSNRHAEALARMAVPVRPPWAGLMNPAVWQPRSY
ncbi:MAG TPA: hypothetical protein VK737_04440, partial [Opitutales bacterium]|nr:hypothetical protein [Opitutales bacterium]